MAAIFDKSLSRTYKLITEQFNRATEAKNINMKVGSKTQPLPVDIGILHDSISQWSSAC